MLWPLGRRIGLCGDAPRAPTQRPGFGGSGPSPGPLPLNPGDKAENPGGLGAEPPNSKCSFLLAPPAVVDSGCSPTAMCPASIRTPGEQLKCCPVHDEIYMFGRCNLCVGLCFRITPVDR